MTMDPFFAAVDELLAFLHGEGYRFVCPTPETVRKVRTRITAEHSGTLPNAATLVDLFGWSLPIEFGCRSASFGS
jgi:hypothetical protein